MKFAGKIIILFLVVSSILLASLATADQTDPEINAVLSSAESLFKSMKGRDYTGIWSYLSASSRTVIVNDTYEAIASVGNTASPELIEKDFSEGGSISKAYWGGFLKNFDPDTVLEQSKWEIERTNGDYAEIKITYKKAAAPTLLRMLKENRCWKVGLVETFGTKK